MVNRPTREGLQLFLGFLSLLAILAAGCGSEGATYPVSGQVTHQGQPLQHGTVMFTSAADTGLPPVVGRIGNDGSYEVRAAPGQYKVVVTAMTETDADLEPDDPGYTAPESLIPEEYSNPMRTPLQAMVTEGDNVVDLEL